MPAQVREMEVDSKPLCVLVDLDGTLADVTKFEHFVRESRRNFDAFHRSSLRAPVNKVVLKLVRQLWLAGASIIVVTGRAVKWEQGTKSWLRTNGVPFDELLMRSESDPRSDVECKLDMFNKISKDFQVLCALDDRPQVIELWRSLGVPVVVVPGTLNVGLVQKLRSQSE